MRVFNRNFEIISIIIISISFSNQQSPQLAMLESSHRFCRVSNFYHRLK
jgi:hypothetical protein